MESVGRVKSIQGPMATVMVEMHGGCCEHCEKETCDIDEKASRPRRSMKRMRRSDRR